MPIWRLEIELTPTAADALDSRSRFCTCPNVPLVNARERTGGITELGMVERRCKPRVASGDTAIQKGRKETLHDRHIELNSQYKRDRAEKVAQCEAGRE